MSRSAQILIFILIVNILYITGCNNNVQKISTNENSNELNFPIELEDGLEVTYLKEINGKLTYSAKRDGKRFIVYGDKEIGMEYERAGGLILADGKLTYFASKNSKDMIVHGDEELGAEYDSVSGQQEIGGKLTYLAGKNGKNVVVHDGKELGKEYLQVYLFYEVGDKVAFSVDVDPLARRLIFEGKIFGEGYSFVSDPTYVNGELAYHADKDGKEFVVYKGKEGKYYDDVVYLEEVGGKLAYRAQLGGKYFVVYDGEELGGEYDQDDILYKGLVAGVPENINGKLAFTVSDKSLRRFVWYNGKQGKSYDRLGPPFEANGKLTYLASEGTKKYLIYGDKEINTRYDSINYPTEFNGKLAFFGKKDGKTYIDIV